MRRNFHDELDQLRLQVELMGVKVDVALERMRAVLEHGDRSAADAALAGDDEIDAMNVSLTERCYTLLARENPVASDLRFVVSVLKIISEFERIGDLALRVVQIDRDHGLTDNDEVFDILLSMAGVAIESFRIALDAWSAQDPERARDVVSRSRVMDAHYESLMARLVRLQGPDAVRTATTALIAGRAMERIGDHAVIVGARLRYLLSGDPDHLTAEVR